MKPGLTTPFDEVAFQAIRDWLYQETALAYPESKRTFMERRLADLAQEWGAEDLGALWRKCQTSETVKASVIDALTINETSFFRMPAHFATLAELMPDLAAGKRAGILDRPKLRLWSAACSTGEEPYSMAMTVLAQQDRGFTAEILATDLCTQALAKARAASYSDWRLENLPSGYREAYFEEDAGGLRIAPRVRELVRFQPHNLKAPPPVGPWDVIFCRNVMIYFDNPFRAELLQRLHDALVPGGVLFVGEGETLHLVPHAFETHPRAGAVVYRRPSKE
ncbi:Chemotaxis protein methyltransferase Cher2 [compost metagenome]